jgi:exosome complex RNA-binding protein Csl4
MDANISVAVPETLKAKIEAFSSEDGVSASEWIVDALERQVFLRRVRAVRKAVRAELDARGESYTDEDIFRMVS